jgi:hypothetical protein
VLRSVAYRDKKVVSLCVFVRRFTVLRLPMVQHNRCAAK